MALILVNPSSTDPVDNPSQIESGDSCTQECPATKNAHAIGKDSDRQWYVRKEKVIPEVKDNAIVWMVQTGKDEDENRQWYELPHNVCQRLEYMYNDVTKSAEEFVL